MRFTRYVYVLLFCVSIVSCNDINRDEFDMMLSEIGIDPPNESVKYMIVIPGQGCSGCLQAARKFMKENYNRDDLGFILTKYDSYNQLRIMYGKDVIENKNVFLDKESVLYNGGFNSMYPAIVEVEDGGFKIMLADPDHYELWNEIN